MEFDTATITGLAFLIAFIFILILWLLEREPEEYPKTKKWRYSR